jgi:uncharacterized protein (TIGR03437 family)
VLLRVFFALPGLLLAQSDLGFPAYSANGVANTAANVAGLYAPNTLISIYGSNLSAGTQAITEADIRGGNLPTSLGALSTRVLIDGQFASLYYASPTQVNALLPTTVQPGLLPLQVVVNGRAGPPVFLRLEDSAPGLFEMQDRYVIATHANGPVVTNTAPAARGEVIVLYATGLGPTSPLTPGNRIPLAAARLVNMAAFHVWLNGVALNSESILYAGVAPGFAGLFQINLRLPEDGVTPDPEIRVGSQERVSPPGRFLHLR